MPKPPEYLIIGCAAWATWQCGWFGSRKSPCSTTTGGAEFVADRQHGFSSMRCCRAHLRHAIAELSLAGVTRWRILQVAFRHDAPAADREQGAAA